MQAKIENLHLLAQRCSQYRDA